MRSLVQDISFAFRMILRNPAISVVAIATLALALGANAAIFSVIQGVVLRPLPYAEPDRLVVFETVRENGETGTAVSYPNFRDLADRTESLSGVGAYYLSSSFLMDGLEPERIYGSIVSLQALPVLGVNPHLGRFFTAEEDRDGGEPVIIISYELWQRKFSADPNIIGRQISFGSTGANRTLIGVMPEGFRFPIRAEGSDFWLPVGAEASQETLEARGAIWLNLFGRLAPGSSIESANAELTTISRQLAQEYPANEGLRFVVSSFPESIIGNVRPALFVLLASVGAVLLIGCANVANLLLARAAGRRREIGIRSALGATRLRIVRQLLVESVVLAAIAGAIGLLLAAWSIDALLALAPDGIPRIDAVSIDATVLLFTCLLTVATGLLFGLVPAIGASRTDLNETLKEGSRGSTEGRGRSRLRNALVIAEITLSLALLVSAGLLIRSFHRITSVDPGFDPRNVVQLEISARSTIFPDGESVRRFYTQLFEKLSVLPGVERIGSASVLPLSDSETVYGVWPAGQVPAGRPDWKLAQFVRSTPGTFDTLGMPLLAGRDFTIRDGSESPAVAVVNQEFVRQHYPGENPVGQRIFITDGDDEREIIGVVGNVRFNDLTQESRATVWVSNFQNTGRRQHVVVRSTLPPGMVAESMRRAVRELDPQQPILAAGPISELIRESLGRQRFSMILLSMLAGLALLLSAVGIYSVMSYSVTQRTSEIGIRMALGADAGAILRMMIGGALRLVIIGVVGGVLLALASGRLLQSLLYGIDPHDPFTLAVIALLLGTIGLIASWIPARRAARIDPLEAIRYE